MGTVEWNLFDTESQKKIQPTILLHALTGIKSAKIKNIDSIIVKIIFLKSKFKNSFTLSKSKQSYNHQ